MHIIYNEEALPTKESAAKSGKVSIICLIKNIKGRKNLKKE
jgi:hypothetical protein